MKDLQKNTAQDTVRVNALVAIGSYYLQKRGEIESDLDSTRIYLQQAGALADALQFENQIYSVTKLKARYFFEKKDFTQCRNTFMQSIQRYQERGEKELEASVWFNMGSLLRHQESLADESIGYLQKAMALYRQTGAALNEIKTLKEIADAHLVQGKLDESEKELLEVVDRYKAIGFKNLHYSYDLLSAVAIKKGNMNRALFYGLETIKSMEASDDNASAAVFYYRLGRIYAELGEIDKSIEWYRKSCDKKVGPGYITCLAVARGLLAQKKPQEALSFVQQLIREAPPANGYEKAYVALTLGNCFNSLHQYGQAEKQYLQMFKSNPITQPESDFTSMMLCEMGDFYVEQHRYKEAEPYLRKILTFSSGIVPILRLKLTHNLLFKIDSVAGNYVSAIQHLQQFKLLNDSLFNISKSNQFEELQIKYETAQKEQNIQLLHKESALQESRLQAAYLTKNLTFGVGALLLIILILLYNRSRQRRLTNTRLELQQIEINRNNQSLQQLLDEKEWLLREIHHRVKNNLQIVMSLLNSQTNYLENDTALMAIRDSQQRIHSISLIHQKLYQSENVTFVEMSTYIRELVDYLQSSFQSGSSIRFDLAVDRIELDVTQAVPLGLILNEAISNAIKYAFPGRKTGLVRVSMHCNSAKQIELIVQDNGVGLPPGFDIDRSKSLGMSLMRGLSKQLNGAVDLKTDHGLTVCTSFQMEPVSIGTITA